MMTESKGTAARSVSVADYGAVAMAFHWTMFLLVVVVGVLGLLHDTWPRRIQAIRNLRARRYACSEGVVAPLLPARRRARAHVAHAGRAAEHRFALTQI